MFGAGDRMGRHEMRMRRQQRLERRDHRALDRADVGDDRARPQRRRDRASDRLVRPDRRAENDAIGAARPLRARSAVTTSPSAKCLRALQGLRRMVGERQCDARRCAAGRAGDRRADQSDADDRELVEDRLGERRPEPLNHDSPRMKSASAATTPRLASSPPTVSRRHSGRP